MQHVELFNYESFTLKTVENLFSSSRRQKNPPFLPFQRSFSGVMEKQSLFHEPTLACCMHMQASACSLTRGFSIQKFTSFSKCEGTIFLSYYRQLLSTKCNEIVYSFLEKRKSNEVSLDLAGKKKIIMAKPFLLFPSFNFALLSVYMSTTLK